MRERVGELPHQSFPDPLLPSHSRQIPKHTLPHWTRHHPLLHGNGIQSGGMLVPKRKRAEGHIQAVILSVLLFGE